MFYSEYFTAKSDLDGYTRKVKGKKSLLKPHEELHFRSCVVITQKSLVCKRTKQTPKEKLQMIIRLGIGTFKHSMGKILT